jgi:uncharacterized protein (TIGR04255 family)
VNIHTPDKKGAPLKRTLPDFECPPAVETCLAIHFDPLEGWKLRHFWLFWEQIRQDYPTIEVHPPLAQGPIVALGFEAVDPRKEWDIPIRCWLMNNDRTRLIQIQNNLVMHNWRKTGGPEAAYLHYDEIRPVFQREWNRFREFLNAHQLTRPRITRCEVTYFNQLERGVGWQSFAALPDVTPNWSGRGSEGFLPPPQAAAIQVFYPMSQNEGQLEIQLHPALRPTDGKELIQLTVAGRCKPASTEDSDLFSSLDLAREWVVRGFTDFTSAKMHRLWRRTI